MKYRKFSNLGWNVSEVGLGCWQIGWCWGDISESDSRKVLNEALNNGINFFDTSDMYGDGRSEKFIGERGRINCSLKEKNGFWRWLGIQYVISEN